MDYEHSHVLIAGLPSKVNQPDIYLQFSRQVALFVTVHQDLMQVA